MVPMFSRKSVLFLLLGIFALLFGTVQGASAATCASYGDGSPYEWQRTSIDDCTIKYDDPTGGSNLTVCQYRVLSDGTDDEVDNPTETLGWTNATGTADLTDAIDTSCSGSSAILQADISIGAGLNCRDNGENKCKVEFKAEDNSGNSAVSPPPIVILDIDYTAPTITSTAPATNAFINSQKVSYTLSEAVASSSIVFIPTGGTPDSNTHTCNLRGTALGTGSHADLVLQANADACVAWANPLVSGTVYTVTFDATDPAGNPATTVTNTSVTYDITAPTITSTAPVTNAFINSQKVSYTLSEAVASGSIVFSRTGGALDSTSHICDLRGTALDYGAHTNLILATDTNACVSWANPLVNGAVYTVTFDAKDSAGNPAATVTNTSVTYDITAPIVDSFKVDNKTYPNPPIVNVNSSFFVEWDVSETGNSNLQKIEVWRAWDANGDGDLQPSEWGDSSPDLGTQADPISTKTTDFDSFTRDIDSIPENPPVGTYWFGIHIIDNANNCITEAATFCPGGVTSDGATRTVRGPIKVIMDKTAPKVDAFDVAPKDPAWVNGVAGNDPPTDRAKISWTVSDTGGANLKQIEVWRAFDNNPQNGLSDAAEWDSISTYTVPLGLDNDSGSYTDATLNTDGTYWYGLHVKDNVDNCITEEGSLCTGDAPSDGVVRADLGPIKVIVDKTPPSIPDDAPTTSTPTSNTKPIWTWPASTDSGGSGVKLYFLNWCSDSNFLNCDANIKPKIANNCSPCSVAHSFDLDEGTWYARVRAQDAAGNWSGYSSRNQVVIDITAPVVTSFTINGNSCSGDSCNSQVVVNSTFTIAWSASESGGSYLDNAKIYQAVFNNTNCSNTDKSGCSWGQVGLTVSAPASSNAWSDSTEDNPADGTYWYGIHIADKAQNCITEDTEGADKGHCNGVTSDAFDTRADLGPIKVKMLSNQNPTISTVADDPDPIKANVQITFTAQWNDPDNDSVSFFVCKNNTAPSGGDCSGGSANRWCRKPVPPDTALIPSGVDAACNYTTLVGDAGTKNYYAFVCDDEDACSSSQSGTFLVDATAPTIFFWSIVPENSWTNGSIKVSWRVLDSGGSSLDRVEIFRVLFGPGCNDTDKSGCVWGSPIGSVNASPNNNDWTCNDCFTDAPGSGKWWYGMHVLDKAGNCTREDGGACTAVTDSTNLKKALVDTINPFTAVTNPIPPKWFNNNFDATLDDSDTGGSGLAAGASGCQYRFIGNNPSGPDISSGDLTRQCDPVTKSITVGPSPDVCRFEGVGRCRVETKSFDVAGNTSAWKIVLYGVDFTDPQVGAPSPTTAQAGILQTYSASLTDAFTPPTTGGGKISGCSFYWKVLAGSWSAPIATTVNPIPCENGAACTVSADHTFMSTGQYDIMFACADSVQPTSNTGYGVNIVTVDSLSVDLSVVPSAGSVNTLFDLTADTAGSTMLGDTTYGFDCRIDTGDCTADGDFADCDFFITTSATEYTKADLCQYSPPGTYTAKVAVQRGVGTAEDTVGITVSENNIPIPIDLSVDSHNPTDYCGVTGYPPVRARWTFSDEDSEDTQGAYELEVFRVSDGVKVVDTGKKTGDTQEYVFQSAGEQLLWDTTYTWQMRVWDNLDDASPFVSGPQFTTVRHYYPVPNFVWTPTLPGAQESVEFTDQTNFAPGSQSKTWSWTFGDSSSSTLQNPTHAYDQTGVFGVTLQSTDDVGSCSSSQTVNVSVPFPEWQEISPF